MKKFLIGFGSFLILLGAGGIVNHISMTFKAIQEEQEMYGGSIQFMILQSIGSMGPYLTLLIGGGIIIAFAAFLNEYQKRSDLNSQLIQVLSQQLSTKEIPEKDETHTKQMNHQQNNTSVFEETPPEQEQDERIFWNG
ncbi:hypothetical protein [Metabacillus litoralis]|uniref:hypothetical protein n=1 Tax=Metabacillus litoralis TaxID=152268 RepID=UPI001CFE7F06|nr:hypothetical protein [Metabacillus litoralis]